MRVSLLVLPPSTQWSTPGIVPCAQARTHGMAPALRAALARIEEQVRGGLHRLAVECAASLCACSGVLALGTYG